jgi:hypothetical protein
MNKMMNGYKWVMYSFVTSLGLFSATAQAQTADKRVAPKWDPSSHVAPAYMYAGLPRNAATAVEYKESPMYHAPRVDTNATLNLDNRRLSDNSAETPRALVAKPDIIAAPVLAPLTMYDFNARLQVAQATFAGAQLGYKQAEREGDQPRMAMELSQMNTSASQIAQLNTQIKNYTATTAAPAKKRKH